MLFRSNVREILDAMGARIQLLGVKQCPKAKESDDDKKFLPPMGLPARLDSLSSKMRRLLGGTPTGWKNPLFTDELAQTYFTEYKGRVKKQTRLKII